MDRFDETVDMIRAVRDNIQIFKKLLPRPAILPSTCLSREMEVMKELLRMRDAETLDENQALWFRSTKAEEEPFDTENDPHELNTQMTLLRNFKYTKSGVQTLMKAIDDKGLIDEKDLIKTFYPNGKVNFNVTRN